MFSNRFYLIVAATLLVAAILGYRSFVPPEVPVGEASPEQAAIDSAMQRIRAESEGAAATRRVSAPPRSSADATPLARVTEPASRRPPDGHTFVRSSGQMAKAPIRHDTKTQTDASLHDVPWMDTPGTVDALLARAAAAGRGFTFGWIRLAAGARTPDARQALDGFGAEILGSSANLVRARLPADRARLQAILELPEVDRLGIPPTEVKLAGMSADAMATAPPSQQVPVFINLITDDAEGVWRRELENLGATVGRFDADIRAYAANVAYGVLHEIARADFVLSIEPVGIVGTAHDTAVPAMGADALHRYLGRDGLFSGITGSAVPIGVMDTGLNTSHLDIASNRFSICGANFVSFSPREQDQDLWVDEFGHGTHVTGTVAGNGFVEPRYAGMAPGVRHIRFAKVLSMGGFGDSTTVLPGMDFLSQFTSCPESGWSNASIRPMIVNMSLSRNGLLFDGRSVAERKLDAIVWRHRQLYVVAQSNAGRGAFSNYGAAKNSLPVGAAMDRGDIASSSSHGPTFDGRLAPLVVATGVNIYSAKGNGSRGDYARLSGTSMASPAVAGVAALLMNAAPEHRWKPALVRARLMASAIKPDFWMKGSERFPLNNSNGPGALHAQYGLGKVSARTSVLDRDQEDGWVSGSAVSELEDGEYAYQEVTVPEGASRLDLVMTWDEPPADAIAASVLNDLDLWLDQDADCEAAACGEFASLSRKDNVEWVIVRNPAPGTWRAKVVAHRVFGKAPRAALAWTVIRGPSTPELTVTADKDELMLGGRPAEITVTVAADGYVAAGTEFFVDCGEADAESTACDGVFLQGAAIPREDNVSPSSSLRVGRAVSLGEVSVDAPQTLSFSVWQNSSDPVRLYFSASAWNGDSGRLSVAVRKNADATAAPEAAAPKNDAFENAIELTGADGARESALLGATAQPGEPPRGSGRFASGRPIGSIWYSWTAPEDGLTRFSIVPNKPAADDLYVEIFRGESLASLQRVASNDWGVAFFAAAQQTYFIRLSNAGRTVPHTLQWARGRPLNDDIGSAARIDGATGSVEGSNLGASTEQGESYRGLASTTWYRWTAPADGDWRFASNSFEQVVLAFSGNRIASLRLVSGGPSSIAIFPASQGSEYRIAVAVRSTHESGKQSYELSWEETNRAGGNDDFALAQDLGNDVSSSRFVTLDNVATVEPGEPVETGIRTRWWAWTAPESGSFTWRLELNELREVPRMTAFSGDAIDALERVGATRPEFLSLLEFVISAEAETRYSMALGLPASGYSALTTRPPGGILRWGATPANDEVAGAVSISGSTGSVTGSNLFATSDPGESIGIVGHSSLWWSLQPTEDGWVRFWTQAGSSMVLAVYRLDDDGGLEFIRSGEPADFTGNGELLFEAQTGADYRIRLGSLGSNPEGSFNLQWEPAEPPMWLEYLGRITSDTLDSNDMAIDLRIPRSMVFNDDGSALYSSSESGLLVFERDAASGGIDLVQTLPANSHAQNGAIAWREQNAKLYARWCSNWRRYGLKAEDSIELVDEGTFAVANQPTAFCGGKLLQDPEGSFVYFVPLNSFTAQVEAYAFNADGTLRYVEGVAISNPSDALMSNSGSHFFAATPNAVRVYRRDSTTGMLSHLSTAYIASARSSLAISDDDRYLYVVDHVSDTTIFDLEPDPGNPTSLFTLPSYLIDDSFPSGCMAAGVRHENRGVDAVCQSAAFAVERLQDSGSLAAADFVRAGGFDRFNNLVPRFTTRVVATSPDGKHAYIGATAPDQIQIFERIGNESSPAEGQSPGGQRLSTMIAVTDGGLRFGPMSTSACIDLDNTEVDDARYSVDTARWQHRESPGGPWKDIDQTQTSGYLCAYTPAVSGEFRMVAGLRKDGVRERHTSNIIRHAAD